MRRRWAALGIAVALASGCVRVADRATPAPVGCQPASRALMAAISEGLDVVGGGSIRDGRTTRSADHAEVWFVAAEVDGAGMEGRGDVGVWAVDDLDGAGTIYSVGGMAHEFSQWGRGEDTDARLSVSDDGYARAESCARG